MLKIKNLHVSIEGTEILKGINIEISDGEVHALMGPNGNGKSTLANAIMGNPKYSITRGKIYFEDNDITHLSVDERARKGIFLIHQNPITVQGVRNSDFIRLAKRAVTGKPVELFDFIKNNEDNIAKLEMNSNITHRYLNEGFSGGEKKKNEILQMMTLKPKLAILDELDSGLDVDALRICGSIVEKEATNNKMGLLIITHYERIFEYIKPTHVHVIVNGTIVESGGYELINKITKEGYNWVNNEE